MSSPTQPRLRLYALALRLYPAAFRARYADEMLDIARLEYARSSHPLRFAASLASDTLRAALREHLRAATPARPGYIAAFALFFSVLLLTVAVFSQQILRRAADRNPAFIAHLVSSPPMDDRSEPYRKKLVADELSNPKQEISSEGWLKSASPIVLIYDASGQPIAGNALLHGTLPRLPHGIFNTIRDRREFRVTWQPRVGIRVALTGDVLPSGGFVVAGQSLLLAESKVIRFHSILLWLWAFAMLACAFLALFARKRTRHPTT
jgi:hypothetical protein